MSHAVTQMQKQAQTLGRQHAVLIARPWKEGCKKLLPRNIAAVLCSA